MFAFLQAWWRRWRLGLDQPAPEHLRRGQLGEDAARAHLKSRGLKFLAANFQGRRGEIDLIFRDHDCLVFVEVKTRSNEQWGRPAAAIDQDKRRRLTKTALDYLRRLRQPQLKLRFDVVEVLLHAGEVSEIRHLPNAFPMSAPHRYG